MIERMLDQNCDKLIDEALRSRPDHLPEAILAGRNINLARMIVVVEFNHPLRQPADPANGRPLPVWPIIRNDPPDADSVLVWDDGGKTIMRFDNEPKFDVLPEVLGLAA